MAAKKHPLDEACEMLRELAIRIGCDSIEVDAKEDGRVTVRCWSNGASGNVFFVEADDLPSASLERMRRT